MKNIVIQIIQSLYVCRILSKCESLPLEGKGDRLRWMKWKKCFAIYTSPSPTAKPLLQEKPLERSENMKKNKKDKRTLGNSYSPYQSCGNDMTAWFEAYKNDSEKSIEIDGKIYAKIIHRCEFYIYKDFTYFVAFEPKEALRIGDILVDELGHEFKVKAFEMIRYATSSMPEWAGKVITMSITGEDYSIGNYLAKI